MVTRDGSEDLRTGVTEQISHTDGKTPSSKHFLNKRYRGKNKERRHWKSKEAEIPSGPLDETLFNLSRAERTYRTNKTNRTIIINENRLTFTKLLLYLANLPNYFVN